MLFWMRSKTYMSKINLQAETTNSGEQEEQREKTDMLRSIGKQSGESVESANQNNCSSIVNKPEHCLLSCYLLQDNSLPLIVSDLPTNCRAYLQRLTDSKTLICYSGTSHKQRHWMLSKILKLEWNIKQARLSPTTEEIVAARKKTTKTTRQDLTRSAISALIVLTQSDDDPATRRLAEPR